MDFPEALRHAMGEMTQEELERRSGVDQSQISRMLRGRIRPGYQTLEKLETALPELRRLRLTAVA